MCAKISVIDNAIAIDGFIVEIGSEVTVIRKEQKLNATVTDINFDTGDLEVSLKDENKSYIFSIEDMIDWSFEESNKK